MARSLRITLLVLLLALSGLAGWAGFAPIHVNREQAFDIPQGTWARRRAGDLVEILPDHIRLTLGLNDVLLIRNHDDVPQTFGPTIMMPARVSGCPSNAPRATSSCARRTPAAS